MEQDNTFAIAKERMERDINRCNRQIIELINAASQSWVDEQRKKELCEAAIEMSIERNKMSAFNPTST